MGSTFSLILLELLELLELLLVGDSVCLKSVPLNKKLLFVVVTDFFSFGSSKDIVFNSAKSSKTISDETLSFFCLLGFISKSAPGPKLTDLPVGFKSGELGISFNEI